MASKTLSELVRLAIDTTVGAADTPDDAVRALIAAACSAAVVAGLNLDQFVNHIRWAWISFERAQRDRNG